VESLGITLFAVIVSSVVGVVIGRFLASKADGPTGPIPARDYFQGLNHLLNERPDLAVETFIKALPVDDETIDTHLALGTLVRRRGEVDKAIRIHQNVLARKDLTRENKVQAELELARDYLQAGLHDRAEHLLDDLVHKAEVRRTALGHLLEIYQRERDWKQAEEIGQKLLDGDDGSVRMALAHFLCERCDEALIAGELRQARVFVERAMDYQHCFRVALTLARVEFESKEYRKSLQCLADAQAIRPELASETLELFKDASKPLGADAEYVTFVEHAIEEHPEARLVDELANLKADQDGSKSAMKFLGSQLARRPSLSGFSRYIAECELADEDVPLSDMRRLRTYTESIVSSRPKYRCQNCGFSGRLLFWQCPSCRLWESLRLVREFDEPL
jgi:lipopolysaccharide biosynthesis regulator YciM